MKAYSRPAMLGAATGMRSMVAPAMLSRTGTGRHAVRVLVQTAAAGELVADKLPGMPSRLEPQPLLARVAIGAVAGGILARRSRGSIAIAAVFGGAGALAGTVIGHHARRFLTRNIGLPDLPVALAEDAIAITIARSAASSPLGARRSRPHRAGHATLQSTARTITQLDTPVTMT